MVFFREYIIHIKKINGVAADNITADKCIFLYTLKMYVYIIGVLIMIARGARHFFRASQQVVMDRIDRVLEMA